VRAYMSLRDPLDRPPRGVLMSGRAVGRPAALDRPHKPVSRAVQQEVMSRFRRRDCRLLSGLRASERFPWTTSVDSPRPGKQCQTRKGDQAADNGPLPMTAHP